MSFWAYMLHCRGGYFYVGHTDDLDHRIAQHKSGLIPGFTADHFPVELVWSDWFQTREDAKAAERRIKGWSRAKKLALIRSDWELVSALARKKNSASTSSAWTEKGEGESQRPDRPELVEGPFFSLQPHPDTPPSAVRKISVRIYMTDINEALFEYTVEGANSLVLPESAQPTRADGLWQSTCFEVFLRPEEGGYFEFNLSPSSQWACYRFASYRAGMESPHLDVEPHIEIALRDNRFQLEADLDFSQIPVGELLMALSAVIEEADGTKSYWALAHPPGKPDFHHPACFTATLPAPSRP